MGIWRGVFTLTGPTILRARFLARLNRAELRNDGVMSFCGLGGPPLSPLLRDEVGRLLHLVMLSEAKHPYGNYG
jgi:hypothetical protein